MSNPICAAAPKSLLTASQDYRAHLLKEAKRLHSFGFNVIALNSLNEPIAKWKHLQERQVSKSELDKQFSDRNAYRIGVIAGMVSGVRDSGGVPYLGVECIDIDTKNDTAGTIENRLFEALEAYAPTILSRLTITRTKSKGLHLIYYAPNPANNQKLCLGFDKKCSIETRGNGGYFAVAHEYKESRRTLSSPFSCVNGYSFEQGNLSTLKAIGSDERDLLINICKSLDESPKKSEEKQAIGINAKQFIDISDTRLKDYLSVCVGNAVKPVLEANDGNKHATLLKQSGVIYSYVKGGLLSETQAREMLLSALEGKNVSSITKAGQTISDGFRHALKNYAPIDLDAIRGGYSAYLSSLPAMSDNVIRKGSYLSDLPILESIINSLTTGCRYSIEAPTGAGKTNTIVKLLAKQAKLFGKRSIIVLPYRALPSQIEKEYSALGIIGITGDSSITDIEEARQSLLCAVTYDSLSKVIGERKVDNLVIDESHNLVGQYNFRDKALNSIQAFIASDAELNVLLVSATPNAYFEKFLSYKAVRFTREANPCVKLHRHEYSKGSATKALLLLLEPRLSVGDGIVVVKLNSKTKLQIIRDYFVGSGALKESEIALIHDNVFIEQDANYRSIIDNALLPTGIRLLLTTSKINDGVNINNVNINDVFVVGERSAESFIQFIARFRKMQALNVHSLRRADDSGKERKPFNADMYANRLIADAKKLSDVYNSRIEDCEVLGYPKKRIMKNADAHVIEVTGKFKPNYLGIFHDVKAEKEERQTSADLYREIAERASYIELQNTQLIDAVNNTLADEIAERSKEERSIAYTTGIDLLASHLKLFLSTIYLITKDIDTKSRIVSYLGYEPTQSPELLAFTQEHTRTLRYDNVQRLATVFLKLDSYGIESAQALTLMSDSKFCSTEAFATFSNKLAIQAITYIADTIGERFLSRTLRRELGLIRKFEEKVSAMGNSFSAHEAVKEVNKDRKYKADKLTANRFGKLLSYTFDIAQKSNVRRADGTRGYSYLMNGKMTNESFEKAYNLPEKFVQNCVDKMVLKQLNISELQPCQTGNTDGIFSNRFMLDDVSSGECKKPITLPYEGYCGSCGF